MITVHVSRYVQAIPTKNQATAKDLIDNSPVYCGFLAKLHSDKVANFESKVIQKLCNVAGIQKSKTTSNGKWRTNTSEYLGNNEWETNV